MRYEQVQDQDESTEQDDREPRPQRRKRVKKVAWAPLKCPYCYHAFQVTDDDTPDEMVDNHIRSGACEWLNRNDPELRDVLVNRMTHRPPTFTGKRRR